MAVAENKKRIMITITREDDENLARYVRAVDMSKTQFISSIVHDIVLMISEAEDAGQGDSELAMRQLLRLGLLRIGQALDEVIDE
jgi:hypothetical protein